MSTTLIFRLVERADGETEVEPTATSAEGEAEAELHAEAEEEVANPILPTANELFYGAITFFLLWGLFKFVLLPPVLKVQEARAEQVRADKEAAEQAAAEAAKLRTDYDAGLSSTRTEAGRIIDDARHASDRKRAQVMAGVDGEIAAERARAAAEVEAAKAAALEELKGGVAGLAVDAASLVVQRDIDPAAERSAIDEYVSRAEAR